ncbi:uncharacterized protein F5Z01DRAFT_4496 [Emericellopsis atlantica]|uniref:Asl1-like glycosyl hydrolase catalytic domain-containing protein n=1 Tax=Emericellopsis atlantica TaxID=2614577 RepID=A0A9P8CX01_9HYPO|nr:uncharacterized protein F5Z01DRAFT_4496 [Emericellopsis atlantica]KAG9258811.1 hypothetical protein F5Z01DRAFT_4496 [Emericellopsis atlantica]
MVIRLALPLLAATGVLANPKRGLVFVPNEDHPEDNKIWPEDSAISWYYNYESRPSPAFADISQSDFAFVPMQWGVDANNPTDDTFLRNVEEQLDGGTNITHVLGFNEPDGTLDIGGSDTLPEVAAEAWVVNFEPLAKRGVKLGLPACTGGWDGMPWLRQFLGNCSEILSDGKDDKKNCTWDFLPVHWYDNVEGLKSHINERREEWPGVEIWVTEYAYAHKSLDEVQEHFNTTLEYFDDSDFIGGYTYFGAFRSEVSNVGPDVTFLNNDGKLTDVGSWYMGRSATGVDPQSGRGESVMISWAIVLGSMGMVTALLL